MATINGVRSTVRLTAIIILVTVALDASAKPKVDCDLLYKEIWEHSLELMKSRQKDTDYFYWGRARLAVEATPSESLERIFSRMSKEDLENLFWAVKSGEAKVTRDQEQMIEELWHMVDDLGSAPFWGPTPNRANAIRDALRAQDAKLNYSGDPAFAAKLTDESLGRTEVEVLGRALAEHDKKAKYPNSKFYDRLVRFFAPYHNDVVKILAANNSIRRRLQKMYLIDEPATTALTKYTSSLELTESEIKALHAQRADTAGQYNSARKDIKALYSREISPRAPLPEAEIRIKSLAKLADALTEKNAELDLRTVSEADMDAIDSVIGKAWNRKHQTTTGMPVEEKHDVHLQIRYPQYARETPDRRAAYRAVTDTRKPKKSEYTVTTEWTVTVNYAETKTRQVPDYNEKGEEIGTKTETYIDTYSKNFPESRQDTLRARYEEVLENSINPHDHIDDLPELPTAELRGAHAVSATNGPPSIGDYDEKATNGILADGARARASEAPHRDQIAHATDLVSGLTNERYKAALKTAGETKKILKSLRDEEHSLRLTRERLAHYQSMSAAEISGQWRYDQERDFRDRNLKMLERYDHMINRIVHLAEQVRRETPSLEFEYSLPRYEPQIARLKEIRDKNRKIVIGTAGAAAAGAASAGFAYREDIKAYIQELSDRRRSY